MAYFYIYPQFYVFVVILLLQHGCEGRTLTKKNEQFVRVEDSHFILDGSPFIFNGFNSYWLMNVAIQPNDRHKVSEVLKEAHSAGLSVCRTLAFSDGGTNSLQISPGTYDEKTFQALDFAISEAGKYEIRLILSFVNNWNDFGGKAQYVKWAKDAGVQVNGDDDFFTNQVIKGYYKNHVEKVITRINTITGVTYRDDPTIMAWELMNEPRCLADISGKTVNGWVQEMAPFVKSIDNKHLLGIGMEGFYGDSVPDRKQYNPGNLEFGTDFISNHQIPDIDYGTIHLYTDNWSPGQNESAKIAFTQRWIASHWKDSKNTLKKPLVIGEFGKSFNQSNYSIDVRDSFISSVYRTTYDLAKQGGVMAGSLIWQLMAEGMDSYYDGYEIVLSQMKSTAGIISAQSQKMGSISHLVHEDHQPIVV